MPITKTRVILALFLLAIVITIQSLFPNEVTLFFIALGSIYYIYTFFKQDSNQPIHSTSNTSIASVELFSFLHNKRNYLQSSTWDSKRKSVLHRDNYTCQCCNATGVSLEVHHLSSYALIPNEPTSALISLCRSCHQAQHNHFGYPQTLEEYYSWNTTIFKGHL